MIEIMSPAGSFESLMAAIQAGANSVYFGVERLNMRARATNNFKISDLKKIKRIASKHHTKAYLTLNTVMYDHDLPRMKEICNTAKKEKIDAIIASDLAAIQYIKKIGLEVHISTQVNVSNIEAVRFFAHYADVIVLARELTLQQIKFIVDTIKKENICGPSGQLVRIELFAHGALCVAIAGKCYMSLATYNASANRGACLQNCRRAYRISDEETGDELVIDNKYVMSPKDLCTIGFLDKILQTGVEVLKIEGRGRAPEYVYTVTNVYKEAVDSYQKGEYTQEKINAWIKRLETVYNRGFWHGGYYLGKKLGEWSGTHGSQAKKEKKYVGIVKNYYPQAKAGLLSIKAEGIKKGDEIIITGPTTGLVQCTVESIRNDKNKAIIHAKKGEEVTLPSTEKLRRNDKVFKIVDRHA